MISNSPKMITDQLSNLQTQKQETKIYGSV